VRCIDFIEQNLQMQQLVACSYFWNSSSGGVPLRLLLPEHGQLALTQQSLNKRSWRASWRKQNLSDWGRGGRLVNRFVAQRRRKAGCCYYHESRGLPPCEQLQSGQLEAEPEAYLSVLRVERFSRDQKTQGNKCRGDK
ncbi:hypothetical protein XENOCAPTIV_004231, partial [Xenoophorus captivus]